MCTVFIVFLLFSPTPVSVPLSFGSVIILTSFLKILSFASSTLMLSRATDKFLGCLSDMFWRIFRIRVIFLIVFILRSFVVSKSQNFFWLLSRFSVTLRLLRIFLFLILQRYRVKNFHFSKSSRPALGSTQPPVQWVPGALSPGESTLDVKLTTHLQLVPRSRKCGSIDPLPHTPSCRSA
jgi:hypothetical protein